ncbi:MAG: hypothetical protein WD651_10965 [Acidimicrobiia bacterium]
MMKSLGLGLLMTLVACSSTVHTDAAPGADDAKPEQLLAELADMGAAVESAETFATNPLGGEGQLICVGAEEVRVYLFQGTKEATNEAARIDPDDPSNLGNAMVAWAGNPRFWHRGEILVLYLGDNQDTEEVLTEVLGPPFARGTGRDPLRPPSACNGR